ncbi:rhomboid protease GluP [archaeon BMS3Bbin15]|nr:rhomboid protease GluP [archaeon BMS3Bbin15]
MRATLSLVITNILIYIYFAFQAHSPLSIKQFAPVMGLTLQSLQHGDFLKLISNLFFHFNFTHLGYNMVFLLIFGSKCEDIFGGPKFLFIYFTTGIFASLSVFLYPAGSILAGASGAIFGTLGSVLVAQRRIYPHGIGTSILYGVIFFIMAVSTGFMSHILGLIIGFIVGYILTYHEEGNS